MIFIYGKANKCDIIAAQAKTEDFETLRLCNDLRLPQAKASERAAQAKTEDFETLRLCDD
jgi:predicted DNA-binding protein (UPF0251 family)